MKLLKQLVLAAAVASIASAASAMTPIADTDLAKVSGQDGVSIAADLHINIGDFTYTNTAANGGSVSFKNIAINGVIGATLDVISGTQFLSDAAASLDGTTPNANTVLAITTAVPTAFYDGKSDVVKIAVPNIDSAKKLNFSIGAISMGHSVGTDGKGTSFGSMAVNDIRLQGSTVYIWAH